MTNRRGFIASLLALPTAAVAAIKSKQKPAYGQVRDPGNTSRHFHMARCFNCQRLAGPSKWLPNGVLLAPCPPKTSPSYTTGMLSTGMDGAGRTCYSVHLCDDCIEAITHCATCDTKLNGFPTDKVEEWGKVSGLRLSPASEPIAFNAWVPLPDCRMYPQLLDRVYFGARPADRDLIVADCPKCALLARRISVHGLPPLPDSFVVVDDPLTSSEIRNICYAFSVSPSQLI
jgi:hypothetical protein